MCGFLLVCMIWVIFCAAGLWSSKGYLGERIGMWDGQRGLSFLQNMELRAGELLVPHAGLYYIYAQTYFRLSSTDEPDGESNGETPETKDEDGAQLVQYIYKKVWLDRKDFLFVCRMFYFGNLAHRWAPTQCPSCSWNHLGVSAGLGARSQVCSPCTKLVPPSYNLLTASSSPLAMQVPWRWMAGQTTLGPSLWANGRNLWLKHPGPMT